MRIPMELPDDLFQKTKQAALERRATLNLPVIHALKRELETSHPGARRMTQPPIDLDLVPILMLRTNAELAAILNEEEACAPFWMLLWQRNGRENGCKAAI